MTMTSSGQLVKLSDAEQLAWSKRRIGDWYHRAAVVWSRCTSVEDRFTGADSDAVWMHLQLWQIVTVLIPFPHMRS